MNELDELVAFFKTATLPTGRVKINSWSTTDHTALFIQQSIDQSRRGNQISLQGLRDLKAKLVKGTN